MGEYAESILRAALGPISAFATPGRRTYWVFLVGAAALALLVWARKARRVPLASFLFAPRLWLHPSAIADYGFVFVRAITFALFFAPLALSTLALSAAVRGWLVALLGPSAVHPPPALAAVAFSLLAFVADDLTRYLLHRAMHRVPALWELHQVHHSAEVLTPVTIYRVHPVEEFLHQLRGRASLGVVAGVFAFLSPGVSYLEILGVELLSFLWGTLGANLRHSQVWLSYGPFEHILISPAQHQLHHSADPAHHGRNFGSALAIWDGLFGTLLLAGERKALRFGIPLPERNHPHAPLAMFWRPMLASCKAALGFSPPRPAHATGAAEVAPSRA